LTSVAFLMSTYALKSINWRRPGDLDVVISAVGKKDESFTTPSPGRHVHGFGGRLIQTERIERGKNISERVWTFRAAKALPGGGGGGGGSDGSGIFWSMDVSLMQAPITSHPNLKRILAAGGGTIKNGEIDWPQYINGQKNPWYGTSDFLVPSVRVTKEFIDAVGAGGKLSMNSIDEVGYSEASLASGFTTAASFGAGRKAWLLESHSARSSGEGYQASRVWRYGGVLGWLDAVYQKDYWS
jgi:hypothetical protein